MDNTAIFEGEELHQCLQKASKSFGVDISQLSFEVLQYGTKQLFGLITIPFKVKVGIKESQKKAAPSDNQSNYYMQQIEQQMQEINASLKDNEDDSLWKEMLENYGELDSNIQKDILALTSIAEGEDQKNILKAATRDAQFNIHITEDHMQAIINLYPAQGEGKDLDYQSVMDALETSKIKNGVDFGDLQSTLDLCNLEQKEIKNKTIAKGTLPQHGKDGFYKLFFIQENPQKPDYFKGVSVKQNQVIAKVHPPTSGNPGVDVHGNILPANSGKPVDLTAGENVWFRKDTCEYVATTGGLVRLEGDTLTVRKILIVENDVSIEVGNIDFEGSIHIRGSVRQGLTITATEDIIVEGSVEAASLYSHKGSVVVNGGIAGHNVSHIYAGKSLECKYAQNTVLFASLDIEVKQALLYCKATAGENIFCNHGKGRITGGIYRAGISINAKVIGAPNEPRTELRLGIELEQLKVLDAMDRKMAKLKTGENLIHRNLERIFGTGKTKHNLGPEINSQITALRKKLLVVRYSIKKLNLQIERMEHNQSGSEKGVLNVLETIYPNTIIRRGGYLMRTNRPQKKVTLQFNQQRKELELK